MTAHMLIDDCRVEGSDGAGDAIKPGGNPREELHHTLLAIEPQTLLLNHALFVA